MENAEINIKEIRYNCNLNQQEFADAIGITREMVGQMERGKKGISKATKILINNFLSENQKDKNVPQETYTEQRRNKKNSESEKMLPYYDVSAQASTSDPEIMPASKQSGVVINEIFKGSKYVIRIAGNSMTPLYPPGGLLGIAPVQMINPGGVYVVESVDGQLWIKRMFYKDDNQDSGGFQLISDNNMKHDNGAREGKLFYPDFFLPFDQVKNLFVVTGIFKSNIITIIN